MSNPATNSYINKLTELKSGDLGLLRSYSGRGIDEAVHAFDLFAGLWWPIRQGKQGMRAPRRHVAWLVAKLYAFRPIPDAHHSSESRNPDFLLARQLRRCEPRDESTRKRFRERVDALLQTPLDDLETPLQWALNQINMLPNPKLDWAQLTDDLSIWDKGDAHSRRKDIRQIWAEEYLGISDIHLQIQNKE